MADLERLKNALLVRRDDLSIDDNEWEQLLVYLEAFDKFMEREAKYHSLWKEYGAPDSAGHLKSKALRTEREINMFLNGLGGEYVDLDDAIDAINYAAFVIRNVREGRVG